MLTWIRVTLGIVVCLTSIACSREDETSSRTDHTESTGGESYVVYEEPIGHEAPESIQPASPSESARTERLPDICPADIEGLDVRVSAVPRGGALVMIVPPDKVSDLRSRLRHFVEVRTESLGEHEATSPHDPLATHGHEEFVDEQAMIHRASNVRVVDLPHGARLEFRLENGEQVQELRAELRKNAQMLRDGLCPLSFTLTL